MWRAIGVIGFFVVNIGLVVSIADNLNHPETWHNWDCNPYLYLPGVAILLGLYGWIAWQCQGLVKSQKRIEIIDEMIAQERARRRGRDGERPPSQP